MDIPKGHTVGSEQYENRPYLVVSSVEINRRGTVIGVPFTSVKDPSRMSTLPPYWIAFHSMKFALIGEHTCKP